MSKRDKRDRGGRLTRVDLDDPTVSQVARMFHALGLRLELWTEPLARTPEPVPESGAADSAGEPGVYDDIERHFPALHPTADPNAWAVYCPGCSTDAHPGVYSCRRDDAPDYWHRLPPQLDS